MRRTFLLSLLLLSACGEMPKVKTPSLNVDDYLSSYRVDIRQGNFVTQEMVSQLKPGQSRDQVRFILGTPLVTDPFHDNRWDYVYRYDDGRGDVQQRRLTVYFEGSLLTRVAGDVAPADPNVANTEAAKTREIEIAPAPGTEAGKSLPVKAE